jgi:hypothetical protein
MKGASAFKRLQ